VPGGTASNGSVTIPEGQTNGYVSISAGNTLSGTVRVSIQSVIIDGDLNPIYDASVTSLFTDVNLSTPAIPATSFSLQPNATVVSSPSTPPNVISTPSSSIVGSAVSPTQESLSAQVTGPGIAYAIDPSPSSFYSLTETNASPSFDTLSFPKLSGVDLYSVMTDNNGIWTSAGTLIAGQLLQLLPGTTGIEVQTEDANGNPFVSSDPMSFYVSFASSGSFAGTVSSVSCFVAGTRIETLDGLTAVEQMHAGDLVPAQFSGNARVVWVGHRRIDCRRHTQPESVWPVRISAGAFGDSLPSRDLWLSPDHAVYMNDVLIPVKFLINEVTIAQVPVDDVTYYHIELDHHDILLAEGLPAESYLDTGDRSNFTNGGGAVAEGPEFSARMWEAMACAPLILAGSKLDAARRWVEGMASAAARGAR
jgi:hypothetical protein